MTDKNLVTNPDAVKPIDSTENTGNAVEERYLFDLFQNLEKAEESQDEAAQLKAFQALQNYYISQESTGDKIGVAFNSAMQGTNKGLSIGIGLPVLIYSLFNPPLKMNMEIDILARYMARLQSFNEESNNDTSKS